MATDTVSPSPGWRYYLQEKVLVIFFLGFSAGLPFPLVYSTLSAWLEEASVERSTISTFAWLGFAYSLKFLWAPIVDSTGTLSMDIFWLIFAFACGFGVKQFGMPPLIGYLAAGFLLNIYGVQMTPGLTEIADLGVTLMLFTIGLKLNSRDLLKPEIWGGAITNMGLWSLLFIGLVLFFGVLLAPHFVDLDMKSAALLAFALSFSSTVCVIKVLEDVQPKHLTKVVRAVKAAL